MKVIIDKTAYAKMAKPENTDKPGVFAYTQAGKPENADRAGASTMAKPENTDNAGASLPMPEPPEEDAKKSPGRPDEERQDIWLFNNENENSIFNILENNREQPDAAPPQIRNNSALLTKRLVMATGQLQVRQIMAEANANLLEVRLAEAFSGEKIPEARAAIRSLERLIDRCFRKIRGLDREDGLRVEKARAEQREQQERAAQIREELRRKERERMSRERRYLQDENGIGSLSGTGHPQAPKTAGTSHAQAQVHAQMPMTEAAIDAKAAIIAAAEAFMGTAGFTGGEAAVATGGGDAISMSGGADPIPL